MAIVTCAAAVSHEKARSPEARATAGLWSVWADAHGLEFEVEDLKAGSGGSPRSFKGPLKRPQVSY